MDHSGYGRRTHTSDGVCKTSVFAEEFLLVLGERAVACIGVDVGLGRGGQRSDLVEHFLDRCHDCGEGVFVSP